MSHDLENFSDEEFNAQKALKNKALARKEKDKVWADNVFEMVVTTADTEPLLTAQHNESNTMFFHSKLYLHMPLNRPNTRIGTWKTLSPGRYQVIHFKFFHLAIPTIERLSSWKRSVMPNAYCKQCLIGRKQVIETDVHLSFSCPNAYGL